jgi:hypothetical protein
MMLTMAELSRELSTLAGRTIDTKTVWKWIAVGCMGLRLPYTPIGGTRFIRWEVYIEWQRQVDAMKKGHDEKGQRREKCIA